MLPRKTHVSLYDHLFDGFRGVDRTVIKMLIPIFFTFSNTIMRNAVYLSIRSYYECSIPLIWAFSQSGNGDFLMHKRGLPETNDAVLSA